MKIAKHLNLYRLYAICTLFILKHATQVKASAIYSMILLPICMTCVFMIYVNNFKLENYKV